MTPEEIEKAYDDKYECPRPSGVFERQHLVGVKIAVDFAIEMVGKHNEECAKVAESYGEHTAGHFAIAKDIRAIKP